MGNLFVWTLPLSLSRVRVVFVSWRRAHREGLSLSVAIWSVRKNLYSAVTIRSFSLFLFFSLMVSRPPASLLLPPKTQRPFSNVVPLSPSSPSLLPNLAGSFAALSCFLFGGSFSSLDTAVCMCVWVCASSVFGDVCLYQGNLNHKWN